MASKKFSETLKELRKKAGFTQKQVYEHFNIPQSTFSSWEVGKSEPSGDMLVKLCEFYKCDMMKEFSEAEKNIVTYTELQVVEKYRLISNKDKDGKELIDNTLEYLYKKCSEESIEEKTDLPPVRLINYYYRLASAGTGQILFDMPPTQRIEIPDLSQYKKVDYAIEVNGNSMYPTYSNGDMLLVEMTEEIGIGEIGIFSVNNECFVKQLGKGELISLNTGYGNIPLNETAKCMGLVIGKL